MILENTSIMASLTFLGDEFDTDYVTTFLDRKPDYSCKKGEGREVVKGVTYISECTDWGIRIKQAESLDMDTHLNPIFDFIEHNLDKLQLLSEKFDANWHIDVCITIQHERTPGMVLTSRQMELASAIKAYISFDLYAHQYTSEDWAPGKCPLCGSSS